MFAGIPVELRPSQRAEAQWLLTPMKSTLILLLLFTGHILRTSGQGAFVNLDFEKATVVPNNPDFGWLDWNLAAPGWGHSTGPDLDTIFYSSPHTGGTGFYMLLDSTRPAWFLYPINPLAGRYSLAFSNGSASNSGDAPWQLNYITQTGAIASDIQSIQLLAWGSFAVFVGGTEIPMMRVGDAFVGDISAFAGTTTDLKIVNTTKRFMNPVIVDNISFSPLPAVPEPSTVSMALVGCLAVAFGFRKRDQ